jgi:tripartite ATP-independent transporter DctP family solute receptor
MKKIAALILSLVMLLGVAAASAEDIVLQVGFENSLSEPVGEGMQKWKELLDARDVGLKMELFPDSQLGAKNDLIDQMLLGEPIMTLADGAFFADYGVKDMGIVFGPFLFDNWDQCWKLIESDWWKDQCEKLNALGIKMVAANWAYGARHTLTTKPVHTAEDLKGLMIRVPTNAIQTKGFEVLGATPVGMALGDVYTALQQGTIDGGENPLSTLYGRKHHEVAKYLILDGHVLNFTNWICSSMWFDSLTPEQQTALLETGKEAGVYNNEKQAEADSYYRGLMEAEGVTVYEPTEEDLNTFRTLAENFYKLGSEFGWSDGLYETVKAAMGE